MARQATTHLAFVMAHLSLPRCCHIHHLYSVRSRGKHQDPIWAQEAEAGLILMSNIVCLFVHAYSKCENTVGNIQTWKSHKWGKIIRITKIFISWRIFSNKKHLCILVVSPRYYLLVKIKAMKAEKLKIKWID